MCFEHLHSYRNKQLTRQEKKTRLHFVFSYVIYLIYLHIYCLIFIPWFAIIINIKYKKKSCDQILLVYNHRQNFTNGVVIRMLKYIVFNKSLLRAPFGMLETRL